MQVHLVIARFDEDVSWLSDAVRHLGSVSVSVFVYDKGATDLDEALIFDLESSGCHVSRVRLPNVGRESHTYLQHVIRMRAGRAADTSVSVFLQGKMIDHLPTSFDCVSSYVAWLALSASVSPLGESGNHACHGQFGSFNAVPMMRAAMFRDVGDSGRNLGEWFVEHLGAWPWTRVEDGPTWWQHGVFGIRSCRFLCRVGASCAYYQSLSAQVDWHVNPEAGHFFERSWCYVFPAMMSGVPSCQPSIMSHVPSHDVTCSKHTPTG